MVVVVALDAVGFLKMYILYRQREGWVVDGYSICIALWYPNLIRDLHTAQSAVVVEPLSRWRMCVLYLAPLERDYTHSLCAPLSLASNTPSKSRVCRASGASRYVRMRRESAAKQPTKGVSVSEIETLRIYIGDFRCTFFFHTIVVHIDRRRGRTTLGGGW